MPSPTHRLTVTNNGINYSLVFYDVTVAFDVFWKTSLELTPKGFDVRLITL